VKELPVGTSNNVRLEILIYLALQILGEAGHDEQDF